MLIRLNSFFTPSDRVTQPSSLYRSLFFTCAALVIDQDATCDGRKSLNSVMLNPQEVQRGSIAARFEERTMSLNVSALGANEPRSASLSLIALPRPILVLARSSQRLASYALRPSTAYSTSTVTTQDRLMFTERLCLVDGSSFGMDVLVSD